jgi:tRNA nucleotidyltransferase/poly(A) polymerase
VSVHLPRELEGQLQRICQILPPGAGMHLVGGAVRDIILKRPLHDMDFVLSGDVLGTARKVANHLGAMYFTLDESRRTGRVIWTQESGDRLVLDFAAQRGPDLESDLRARDFTVNAMALTLEGEMRLLDPLGGAQDLREKRLKPCSPDSLTADPVRILRAVRLSIALNLRMSPDTRRQISAALDHLPKVSNERLRDEIMRILEGPRPDAALRLLDLLGVLPFILPELTAMKGVRQSLPHQLDVWEQSLSVLRHLDAVIGVLELEYQPDRAANLAMGLLVLRLGRYRQQFDQHFHRTITPDRSLRGLLFLAALYHDAGKPQAYQQDANGKIRFLRHEQISAELALRRGQALPLSNDEVDWLVRVVRHHMRPHHIAQTGKEPTRRTIYRFFRDCGPSGVDICLLALADCLATYETTLPQDLWANYLDVIRLLLHAYWEKNEQMVSPPGLINGHDLIDELSVPPGPQIGRLLELIREAQATGRVKDREQALRLARSLASQSSPNSSQPPVKKKQDG